MCALAPIEKAGGALNTSDKSMKKCTNVIVLQAPTTTHPYPPSGTSSTLTGGGAGRDGDALRPPDSALNDNVDNSTEFCSTVVVLMANVWNQGNF